MNQAVATATSPRAELWANLGAVALLFCMSRFAWVVAQYYHSHSRAHALLMLTLAAALLTIPVGYGVARLFRPRAQAWVLRALVLVIFFFLVALQLRQVLAPGQVLSAKLQASVALAGIALAALGASRLAGIWPRLRKALLVAAVIGPTSVFLLAAVLAPRKTLLEDSQTRHRPVVVLLLDEFSAGSALELLPDLERRGLQVGSWQLPTIGDNTIDVIPALFTGIELPDSRPCTNTAVCGHKGVVDFARLGVARPDVDIVGIYHHYCAIAGLRHCVNPERGFEGPLLSSFLCPLPVRLVLGERLRCDRTGYAAQSREVAEAVEKRLFEAPFWSKGGLLYAHLFMPHPPSVSGETRLADAYAANVARTRQLVGRVLDHLESAPWGSDYTLVITSDHHLRAKFWCATEPYASHDCTLPEAMRDERVPFFVATRGAPVAHAAPATNADLLPIVAELSRPR